MAEIHIHLNQKNINIEQDLLQFASEWDCELQPIESGYILFPPIMLRKYGIFFFSADYGWKAAREEDATSWEDFLFAKLAHELGASFEGTLYYEDGVTPKMPEPHKFATFDHYVETILEHTPGIVKETKRVWLYSHQKRSVR
jgi:hypothetical protein